MTSTLDSETLGIFVEEAKEHLETIESDLLTIERQGKDFDEDLVNKIFRAAHSLKGGAGFLGLNTMKELAHKIENVLQNVRNFQLVPSSDVVNTVLAGFDMLSAMLEQPEESEAMEIGEEAAALEKLLNGDAEPEPPADTHTAEEGAGSSEVVLTESGRFSITHPNSDISFEIDPELLNESLEGGKNLYILDINLNEDIIEKSKTFEDFINLLEDSGSIVLSQPDWESIATGGDSPPPENPHVAFLFTSIVEPDLIPVLLGIDLECTFSIARHMIREATGTTENRDVDVGTEIAARGNLMVDMTAPTPAPEAEIKSEPRSEPAKEKSAPAAVKPAAKKPAPVAKPKANVSVSETLRVSVKVLDQLMNHAGELVLARNQLVESVLKNNQQGLSSSSQRISQVTSELQEAIMLTRMQPIGNIFNKFPRIARDIAKELNKKIELVIEGNEVELDKTIIEGLGDPLTHLVRNSADHGIETPDIRIEKGKTEQGTIDLIARYESGQVIIEIKDDGKGLNGEKIAEKAVEKGLYREEDIQGMSEKEKYNLIMLPGFSTAEQVTEYSGRGVGMDVVKTNLEKMGGQIEIQSAIDKGTVIRIKLPLTLAIIPSLIISACDNRFALPQVNVRETIRIPMSDIRENIEKIGGADVLILRGELIPLLQLNNVLELARTYYDYKTGTFQEDRRANIFDERLVIENETMLNSPVIKAVNNDDADVVERRVNKERDVVIVILDEGAFRYGLLVDSVADTNEIVVKPLGRYFSQTGVYAGATIMGDGQVALILDVPGLANRAELKAVGDAEPPKKTEDTEKNKLDGKTRQTLLLFHNGPNETCAVPLYQVLRVEQISVDDIEIKAGKKVIQYRTGHLPVYALEEVASVEMLRDQEKLIVIVFLVEGNEVGLLAVKPLDVMDADFVLDEITLRQTGISGSMIINGKTTYMVDIYGMMQALNPDWFHARQTQPVRVAAPLPEIQAAPETVSAESADVLLVEDSEFFRVQVKRFIEEGGFSVVEAEDGQVAWNLLNDNPEVAKIVVTDIEMPNMDGFELTSKIRSDVRTAEKYVVALTSLAAREDVERGKSVGINDYQIKLDRDKLLNILNDRLG